MEKEDSSDSNNSLIIFSFLAIVLIYLLIGILVNIFNIVQLSPFFPEFAPFDATVTLDLNFNPFIFNLDNEIFICEGNRINHYFNVSDRDRNLDRVFIQDPPPIPVFAQIMSVPLNPNIIYDARIFSGITDKSDVGSHNEIVGAVDKGGNSDSRNVLITVIEKNNLFFVENIGVSTIEVYTIGENSTFYKQINASDIEDGTSTNEKLGFNLTFLNYERLFNISKNGTMYFDPNQSLNLSEVSLPLVLNLRVCVNDSELINPHAKIVEYCGQDGSSWEICHDFSLTITDKNRAPVIIGFNPVDIYFDAPGESELYFNVTVKDPDGTIPDIYWYADNVSQLYVNSTNFSEFRYKFPCGASGNHTVRVDATDGMLNDSLTWVINVGFVACPAVSSSGGGGGGSAVQCKEDWGCLNWNVCQDIDISLEQGLLSKEDYSRMNENCRLDSFPDNCGFQLRDCVDTNLCKTNIDKPNELQHCYFIENPSCFDGIKDCHSGGCEVLVDCGGPCDACPTCSDGIKNQGEIDKDCGGPCPNQCIEKKPFSLNYLIIILILISILLVVVIIQLINMYKTRNKIKKLSSGNKV